MCHIPEETPRLPRLLRRLVAYKDRKNVCEEYQVPEVLEHFKNF